MNAGLMILLNMGIAGFVGGITNHLAIKMLFFPRTEKRVGPWRVPFTPGLIPKRKDEIGRSLGKVVADHLVTTEGLQNLLEKPEFRARMEERLGLLVNEWTSREDTVEELLHKIWSKEALEAALDKGTANAKEFVVSNLERMWTEGGWSGRRLGSLIPGWTYELREELTDRAVRMLVNELRKELDSFQGERMLKQMTAQFMEQAGGFLGALAGMFMDTDKTAGKVKQALVQQLESPAVQSFAGNFIRDRLIRLENMTLDDALRLAAGGEPREWLAEQADRLLDLRGWWDKLAGSRLSDVLGPRQDWLLARIPEVTRRVLGMLSANMPRLLAAVQLPKLVEEEVRNFPIEQVENIILSVSGKEFRAITWLGVLLGGSIGLFQSLFMLWQM